ncbi:MAG: FKBP-type peptidyl-prolyl cis-trans isomerase [Lentimicrobiaceae bacterium]|jgi:FKBP-type peptidyl-prolyl cis-trans isomerase|nr:FKBP-type peptidyl-prolyl cis-trans isomerase [Lentimicrobiaceae bacterium]
MKKIIVIAFFLTVSTILFMSCRQNPYKDFQETNTGLLYKFHVKNDAPKPKPMDVIFAKMRYAINDSILFNDSVRFLLLESLFPGDFYEGIAMMGKGDSATFITKADSTMLKIFRYPKLPPNITPETMIQFDFMIQDIMTNEAYQASIEEAKNKQIAEMEAVLATYIKENNINVKPTKSGLYFIEQKVGKGKKPKEGEVVEVHYTGRLLDGTVFDSSYDRGKPIDFTLGKGQVIAGWEEGIAMLRKGGKAQLIIPFHLAYGERSAGSIPPYSSLIFDVELVDIK